MNIKQELNEGKSTRDGGDDDNKAMSESTPEISCEIELANSRSDILILLSIIHFDNCLNHIFSHGTKSKL